MKEEMSDQRWHVDPHTNLRYYNDHVNRQYVYENGRRVPWPTAPAQASSPPTQPRTISQNVPLSSAAQASSSASAKSHAYELAGAATNTRKFQARTPDWFRRYRVFMWHPTDSSSSTESALLVSNIRDEDRHVSGVCRYVVIEEPTTERPFAIALPILSYSRQGVAAQGVVKHEHGIAYTTDTAPNPHQSELPTREEEGKGMVPNPVRVVPDYPTESLHPLSRINYGLPQRIPVTAEVIEIGLIHRDSTSSLMFQYTYVQRIKEQEKYKAEFQKRKAKGQHEQAILQYLTGMYRNSHPNLSWEQAWAVVKKYLEN